ncbi:citrate/2-methylcitrate synthase [Brevundimonas variabilis]|uniref:citrate synthase (unknown stereospecificity) n=1 Tax=Brevundimonas variabilis TaxID=74312 RepID=A0A7W9CG02_9CAUL|nr:citrate/2-methylcitrate synthase [Brevundimonas variabilis]MBB5744968.1 citrate synthase [Brevundimonas variabilis]
MPQSPTHWIDRDEALARLGVKSQTLYAYVSRRRIAARPDPKNPRRSLYSAEDIARLTGTDPNDISGVLLAPEGLPGRMMTLSSHLTTAIDGRLFYRGQDVVEWSQTATLEDTAGLIWDAQGVQLFQGLGPRLDIQPGLTARARLFAAIGRRAQEDRGGTASCAETERLALAASALNEGIDAIAGLGPRLHFHQRLGRAWKVLEREQHALRRVLVLVADHQLDAAALATRVATGGGASPAAAAMAGLVTLVHGTAASEIERSIAHVQSARRDPIGAARQRLEAIGMVPGFGDALWPDGDPRAQELITQVGLPADLMAVVEEGQRVSGQSPTLALALALVARKLDLPREGAVDLYLIGRLVGLLGHALDQASNGSPITARLRYVGLLPGAN